MTLARAWALQQAVYSRLAAALIAADGASGPVPVYDHPPADPARLHVRIDAFSTSRRSPKNARISDHAFTVHVFDRGDAASAGRGAAEVRRVLALADTALDGWAPFSGEPAVRLASSATDLDADGFTQHAFARYTLSLGD